MRKMMSGSHMAVFMVAAAALCGGCAQTSPRQPAAPVAPAPEPARPTAAQKTIAAPVAQTALAPPAPPAAAPQAPAAPTMERSVGLPKPDTYVVQPGDTLALIARRPEIYGDASMWMMLYRGNLAQIASVDWLCPGQVLSVPRNFSEADTKAVREESLRRAPWPPGAKATPIYFCRGLPGAPSTQGVAAKPAEGGAGKANAVVSGKTEATAASRTADTGASRAAPGAPPAEGATKPAATTPPRAPVAEATASVKAAVGQVPAANAAAAPPAAASKEQAGAAASAAARKEAAAAPTTAPPVTVGLSRDAFRDAARRAYNVGDIPWATYYYRQHLLKSPRDAEALGELGNIYYRAGNLPVAAGLYYDAARVLIDRGNRTRAAQLLLAVSEGNPSLADDLYARLMAPAPR